MFWTDVCVILQEKVTSYKPQCTLFDLLTETDFLKKSKITREKDNAFKPNDFELPMYSLHCMEYIITKAVSRLHEERLCLHNT